MCNRRLFILLFLLFPAVSILAQAADEPLELILNNNCVVSVLNRTVSAGENGEFSLPNVPSTMGLIRARATCIRDGKTLSGQTDYFAVVENQTVEVGSFIQEGRGDPIAIRLNGLISPVNIFDIGESIQVNAEIIFANGSLEPADSINGTNYISSSQNVFTVSNDGEITSVGPGEGILTIRKDGVVVIISINVFSFGDQDGDGLPDDYEILFGLDPNDPVDAFEDQDKDGLSALEEFEANTNPTVADTDGDGIDDGEELIPGKDGIISDPTVADTDGDGLSDGIEVLVGSDPNDSDDANYTDALVSISSSPATVVMTFNGIDSEVSTQLNISGLLIDGNSINLTSSSNTNYQSADLTVVSFGAMPGLIFGGLPGTALVTVTNSGRSTSINVIVKQFEAEALSAVIIPGYANNVDISGDYAFVAAGAAGLQVVDVSDRTAPQVVASLDTDGISIDIKVVGDLAYIADGEAGLKIINIANPLLPELLSSLDTAGIAQDLAVQIDYVYVADGNSGIEIINIAVPEKPVSTSVLSGLGKVSGIDVEESTLVVTAGTALVAIDVSDPASPMRLGSVNIGQVKDLVLSNGYAHVASYSQGYRIVDVSNPMIPRITGGDASIAPRDVALTRNFAFYAEQLFPNVVAFVNVFDPEQPVFSGTINLSSFGDYAGTGISLDASYAYITEERYVVRSDYGSTGDTKLFIAQYRDINDNNGVAPTVNILNPINNSVVVEGRRLVVTADATDDVAVASVSFSIDNTIVFTDTSAPFNYSLTIPNGDSLEIFATAIDLGGNSTQSELINLIIQPDADKDGLGDDEEVDVYGTDPNNADSDDDGLLDGDEIAIGSNPLMKDTDSDGFEDKDEVDAGTDPTNPDITLPTVLSTDPADLSVDIPENTIITITFDEALRAKSVNANSVTLLADNGGTFEVFGKVRLVTGNTQILFTPDNILLDFTTHLIKISGVRDEAGNILVDYQTSFETGNFVDLERPTVVDSNPVTNAIGVPINTLPSMLFSEPIDPDTVTTDNFYLQDTVTNSRIEGTFEVSEDKTSVTFIPNAQLLVGRRYYLRANSTIADLFGNVLSTTLRYFTTGFDNDITGPEVVDTTFSDEATDIPTNVLINIRFSEAINPLSLANIRLVDSLGEPIFVVKTIQNTRQVVRLTPKVPLNVDSAYQLQIDGVKDLGGNIIPRAEFIDFTTGAVPDNARGNLLQRNIPNGATTVPLNAKFEIVVSETVDPTTIQLNTNSFRLLDTVRNLTVPATFSISADGKTIELIPNEALNPNRVYYWYTGYSPYMYDLAGNFVALNSFISFTTGEQSDATAPALSASNILNNSINLPLNAHIVLTLNEKIGENCLANIVVSDALGEIAIGVSLSVDKHTVTLTPSESLLVDTTYTVDMSNLCDYAGNAFTGDDLTFTTGDSTDNAGPVLQSITPNANAIDVGVNTQLVLTFNENISANSIVKVYAHDTTTLISGAINISANTLTFTPAEPLLGGLRYRIEIRYLVNDFVGTRRYNGDSYFTTEALIDDKAPTVTMVSPSQDSADVDPVRNIVVTFSEAMNPASINNNNIALYVNGKVIKPNVFRSSNGRQVTISATKPAGSLISLVMTDKVTDLSGNALSPFISTYVTGVTDNDGGRPSISRQIPSNGSSGWLDLNEILLYTNEPMNETSIVDAFNVAENGVLITDQGTLEVLADSRTIRFTKDTPFSDSTRIEIFLTSDATDDSGNPINNYSGYFTTGAINELVGTRPYPQAYSPLSNQTDVALNPLVMVQYNEPLDESKLADALIDLQVKATGSSVPTVISLDATGKVLRVTPQELLQANTMYELHLDNIVDTDGDINTSFYRPRFTTGVDAVEDNRQPMVVSLSPSSGQQGVGVNAIYAARYDEKMNPITFDYGTGNQRRFNAVFSENNQVVKYERLGTLPQSTEITENAPLMTDIANNQVVARSTTFETGIGPDIIPGTRLALSIVYGALNVALNPVVESLFSEAIDPVSVTSAVRLYDTVSGLNVPTTVNLSENGLRLTMVPEQSLAVGRVYYVYKYGMRDLSGNSMGNHFSLFTTGFTLDNEPPQLVDSTINDEAVNVPTNAILRFRFNEPLNSSIISDTNLGRSAIKLHDTTNQEVAVNLSLSSDKQTIKIIPRTLLDPQSDYNLIIKDLNDLSNNALTDTITVNFNTSRTVDIISGSLLKRNIPNGATTVPLNAKFEIVVSETVDPTTIQLNTNSFRLLDTVRNLTVPATFSISADGKTIELIPNEALNPNRVYYWYTGYSPYMYDLAGNFVALNSFISFTTGEQSDATAPALSASNILNNSINLPLNAHIVLTLNEKIGENCLANIVVSDALGEIAIGVSLSVDKHTVTLTPSESLLVDTTYTVDMSNLCDYAGNAFTGDDLTFTTGDSTDNAGPVLQSITPNANAIDVGVNTQLVLTFNENISANSIVKVYAHDTTTLISGAINISANTLTFTPAEPLLGGLRYRIEIRYLVNDFVGTRRYNGDSYFTTEALIDDKAPTVTMVSPSQDSADVDPVRNIVVTFSEAMNPASINNNNIALYVNGKVIKPNVFRSSNGRQVTISATKPAGSLISLVMTDKVTDLSGNALSPFISTYVTGVTDNDGGRPSISRQIPSNGSSGWLDLNEILLYTNEPMNETSIVDAFNVAENGVLITDQGTLEVLADSRTIRFTKDTPFSDSTRIEIFLTSDATDDSGNPINNYSGYFTTGAINELVGTRPYPQAYSPLSNQTDVALNPLVMVQYNEPLDESKLADALIDLQVKATGSSVPTVISLDATGKVLRVTPQELLQANTMYELHLDNIVDTDGDINTSFYRPRFTTGVDAVEDNRQPMVVSLSPSSGQQGVGVNAIYAARYDEKMNPITFDYGTGNQRRFNAVFSENNQVVKYERLGTLPQSTEITENAPLMTDIANNQVVARSTTFETGIGPDIIPGTRLALSIVYGALNVALNPVVESLFSEAIDPVSVTSAVRLYDTVSGLNVPTTVNLSENGLRLTMVPEQSLAVGRVYYVYKYGMRDLSGNSMGNHFSLFTTGADDDSEAPEVVDSSVSEGLSGVPINARLRVRYNEPLSTLRLAGVILEDSLGNNIPVTKSLSANRKVIIVLPKALLVANTSYALIIQDITDLSGNSPDIHNINFQTGSTADFSQGVLLTQSIDNGMKDVARNARFIATLNERVDPTSVQLGTNSLKLYDTTDGSSVLSSFTLSSDGKTLELIPENTLEATRLYYWYLGYSPYIFDLSGNTVAVNRFTQFTTGNQIDNIQPFIINTNIPDNAVDIPINARLQIVFDEPLSNVCTQQAVLSNTGGVIPSSNTLSSDKRTLTLIPASNLSTSTNYTVTLDGICDYSGNAVNGESFGFTTSSSDLADTTGPSIQSIIPVSNATDIDVNTQIQITFNEAIAINSTIVLHGSGDAVISGSILINNSQLTFTPDADLASGTRHRIEIRYLVNDYVGTNQWNGDIYFNTQ